LTTEKVFKLKVKERRKFTDLTPASSDVTAAVFFADYFFQIIRGVTKQILGDFF
jgi:hypothetical protein